MWPASLPPLACPDCRAEIRRPAAGRALRCPGCGRSFVRSGGILRLLPVRPVASRSERRTLGAFDRQWQSYGRLRRLFGKAPAGMAANLVGPRISRHIGPAWYPGKRVLDAGCGHGRYLEAFAALGAEVVGLDAGASVDVAARRARSPHVAVVQGSVLRLPFPDRVFDLVFCDGVIHHTLDARAAYRELARVVRPRGALYVWVYPREGVMREALFGLARAVTTRLPGPAQQALALALAPLTLAVRSYSGTRLGRATWAECAQVVHDWLAPPLQSHHDWEEVAGWAAACGLSRVERLPIPTGITAWRDA